MLPLRRTDLRGGGGSWPPNRGQHPAGYARYRLLNVDNYEAPQYAWPFSDWAEEDGYEDEAEIGVYVDETMDNGQNMAYNGHPSGWYGDSMPGYGMSSQTQNPLQGSYTVIPISRWTARRRDWTSPMNRSDNNAPIDNFHNGNIATDGMWPMDWSNNFAGMANNEWNSQGETYHGMPTRRPPVPGPSNNNPRAYSNWQANGRMYNDDNMPFGPMPMTNWSNVPTGSMGPMMGSWGPMNMPGNFGNLQQTGRAYTMDDETPRKSRPSGTCPVIGRQDNGEGYVSRNEMEERLRKGCRRNCQRMDEENSDEGENKGGEQSGGRFEEQE